MEAAVGYVIAFLFGGLAGWHARRKRHEIEAKAKDVYEGAETAIEKTRAELNKKFQEYER